MWYTVLEVYLPTWESRIDMVMMSWYTVPTAPRRFTGEISDRYMGARPAFSPELIPIIRRPENPYHHA